MGTSTTPPNDRTALKIAALSAILSLGAFWMVQASWPEASRAISVLSPLAFDEPESTYRRALSGGVTTRYQPAPRAPDASRRNVLDLIFPSPDIQPPRELQRAADSGDLSAQLGLAQILEQGRGGVRRDAKAARRWMRRAAGAGSTAAMHNLGLYLLEGTGGPSDAREAGEWFRRAAERGVVDAQFNLAVLAMAEEGVAPDLNTAYFWFAVAARAGDADARSRMNDLAPRLSDAERLKLDQEANRFRPLGDATFSDADLIIAPASTLLETQRLLARKGYYVGELDGRPNLAFLKAASTYLRAHPQAARPIDLPQ